MSDWELALQLFTSELVAYLEHISRHVLLVLDLQRDFSTFLRNCSTGLDLVISVSTGITVGSHDNDVLYVSFVQVSDTRTYLEIGNIDLLHQGLESVTTTRTRAWETEDLVWNHRSILPRNSVSNITSQLEILRLGQLVRIVDQRLTR